MKKKDEAPEQQPSGEDIQKKPEVTSASIANAHATGDGAVQKSDELPPFEDDDRNKQDINPY